MLGLRSQLMSSKEWRARKRPRVLIAGGGVAGVEALLALRALAEQEPEIELVSPDPDLAYRPLRVTEPFGLGELRRFPLKDIAADQRARFHPGALTSVDPELRRARLRSGGWLSYDALLVATGARARNAVPGALPFHGPSRHERHHRRTRRARGGPDLAGSPSWLRAV